jgi:hypothetical protein
MFIVYASALIQVYLGEAEQGPDRDSIDFEDLGEGQSFPICCLHNPLRHVESLSNRRRMAELKCGAFGDFNAQL